MKITQEHTWHLPAKMAFLIGFELEPGSNVRSDMVRVNGKLNKLQFLVLLVGSFEDGEFSLAVAREYTKIETLREIDDFERLAKSYFNAAYGYGTRHPVNVGYHRHNHRPKLFQHSSKPGHYELTIHGKTMFNDLRDRWPDDACS
jgi:hypothetical protein